MNQEVLQGQNILAAATKMLVIMDSASITVGSLGDLKRYSNTKSCFVSCQSLRSVENVKEATARECVLPVMVGPAGLNLPMYF